MRRPELLHEPLMPADDAPAEQAPPADRAGASSSDSEAERPTAVQSLLHRVLSHVEVQRYVQGVVTYVLSRQWKDLFAIYALRLQPLPYCSNVIVERIPCTAPATLGIQALFVLSLLVGAAVVARISAQYEHYWPRLRTVPAMAGMCVGWSFGDLSLQLLNRLAGGVASNFALAMSETLLGAALLAAASYAAEPTSQPPFGFGGGGGKSARNRVLPVLHVMRAATWPLVSHALGVGVMVTWAHSLKSLLEYKLDVDPLHGLDEVGYEAGLLYKRLLLLWGISSTAVSALLVTRLVGWRNSINQILASCNTPSRPRPPLPPPTSSPFFFFDFTRHRTRVAVNGRTAGLRTALQTRVAVNGRTAGLRTALQVLVLIKGSFGWVIGSAWTDVVVLVLIEGSLGWVIGSAWQVLVLIEGSLGWVVGSAWTDVVVIWTSLVRYPTVGVTLEDLGVTIGLTLGGVVWLLLTGVGDTIEEAKKADRWHVEMYFLTRAMAFFVGWSWIALCRDVSVVLAYHDSGTPVRNYIGQVAVAFALGPMLTIWLVRADAARRVDATAVAPTPIDDPPDKPMLSAALRARTARDDSGSHAAAEDGNYVLADE